MHTLVLFSTTEGHTRKLAQFVASRLNGYGHEVQLHDAAHLDLPDAARFDAALLLASVHLGRYQRSFIEFVRKNSDELNLLMYTVQLSVVIPKSMESPSNGVLGVAPQTLFWTIDGLGYVSMGVSTLFCSFVAPADRAGDVGAGSCSRTP